MTGDANHTMNLVQEMQLCVCLCIIRETPKSTTPEEYAKSLQKAIKEAEADASIKEVEAAASTEDSKETKKLPEAAGTSKNGGRFSSDQAGTRSSEPRIPKIFVKPFRNLLSTTSDGHDNIKAVSCEKSPTPKSSKNSIDTTLATFPKAKTLKTTTPKKRSLRRVPGSSKSGKTAKIDLITSRDKMSSIKKRINPCLPRSKYRNIPSNVTKEKASSVGKIFNGPERNQGTQMVQSKENPVTLPVKQNENLPSTVSKTQKDSCSLHPSDIIPQPSTHEVTPMPGRWAVLPSFLEELGYRQYFIVAEDKAEALMLILNDVLSVARLVVLKKRTFSESAIEEMFQVIKLSEANDAKITLNLCVRFYTDVLKALLNLHLQNDLNFECGKKACDVIKKIFLIHWRYLEACGEKTTRFLCHLLELKARGCFVDDIGFCAVDLLETIVNNVNKTIENQTASNDEMNLNLIDVALKVVSGGDPHLRPLVDAELEEDVHFLLVCLKRWKWMLQNVKEVSNANSLFMMQVEALFQQMERSTK